MHYLNGILKEYAVLDKAGRVQIPRELLEAVCVKENKVRMEMADGRIVDGAPEGKQGK